MEEPKPEIRNPRKGDTIGNKYVVDGQLGRGGMGRVLKVHHKDLGHYFAMKVPKKASAMSEDDRKNFFREALLASSVTHHHICNVFDFGEDERFGPFMVMEYIDGQNLRKKIQHDGGMNSKVAVGVMLQVASAIAFVHEKSIFHGDIKSENILISRRHDGSRHMKLLDFGLARQLNADTGSIQGTPNYLAPERIQGAPRTECADVYALGILFYELIAGDVPFKGSIEDVMRSHLQEHIPPASLFSKKNIDERIDTIIEKATKKKPEERYPTVDALFYELKTLSNMLGNKPTKKRTNTQITEALFLKNQDAMEAYLFRTMHLPAISFNDQSQTFFCNHAFETKLNKKTPSTFEEFSNLFIESDDLSEVFASMLKKESSNCLEITLLDSRKRFKLYINNCDQKVNSALKGMYVTAVMVPEECDS